MWEGRRDNYRIAALPDYENNHAWFERFAHDIITQSVIEVNEEE